MAEQFIIVSIIFLAVFTQSLSGFGFALVAMSLLPTVIGIQHATPLVALVMVTIEVFLLIRYRHALNFEAVWRIVLASLPGIPFGILFLSRLDEGIMMTILGFVITCYALYALLNEFTDQIPLPRLEHQIWAYGSGFFAGLLGGAYNTSGPPVIVYGNCRRWETAEFKSNLQGFFVISSLVIAIGHAWNRNLTPEVWHHFLWSIPAMAVGIVAGTSLDKYLRPVIFRRIVLVLLIVMGVRLIFVS
jgi:uncharacterized membrane protein YfcA